MPGIAVRHEIRARLRDFGLFGDPGASRETSSRYAPSEARKYAMAASAFSGARE